MANRMKYKDIEEACRLLDEIIKDPRLLQELKDLIEKEKTDVQTSQSDSVEKLKKFLS